MVAKFSIVKPPKTMSNVEVFNPYTFMWNAVAAPAHNNTAKMVMCVSR